MIKTVSVVCAFLISAFSITICSAQNRISGKIKGLQSETIRLVLEADINRRQTKIITDIPKDKDGSFDYTGHLSPNIYSLYFNDSVRIMLAIDTGQHIRIKGSGTDTDLWEVSGSEDTRVLREYERFRTESLDRLVNSVRREIKLMKVRGVEETDSSLVALTRLELENYELHRDELMQYVQTRMGNSLAIYPTSLRWSAGKYNSFLSRLALDFEKKYPGSDISKKVTEKVDVLISTSIGGKVSDIQLLDMQGQVMSLSNVKAKYILIDFWASWCVPCRRESPLLNKLYQKYQSTGLEIYSVSMDQKKESWLRAIEKDQRHWINVSDLQGFESSVAFAYGVTSLPSNMLVDMDGKVLGKNLHDDELTMLIDHVFHVRQD